MTLEQYLKRKRKTPADFAREMNVPHSTISRILNGQRDPSLAMYAKMHAVSGGLILMQDMLKPRPIVRRKKKKPWAMTGAERRKARDLVRVGWTVRQAAAAVGRSPQTLYANGIKVSPTKKILDSSGRRY